MRKKILLLIIFISTISFSWEISYKSGINYIKKTDNVIINSGLDILPFNKGKYEFGIGFECNFFNKENLLCPIYLVNHINLYRKNYEFSIYFLDRIGNGIYKFKDNNLKSSFYYALGFGIDYNIFILEAIYDGALIYNKNPLINHKFGVKFGIKVDDFPNKKLPPKKLVKPLKNLK